MFARLGNVFVGTTQKGFIYQIWQPLPNLDILLTGTPMIGKNADTKALSIHNNSYSVVFFHRGQSLPGSNENVVVFKSRELLTLREKLTSRDKVRPVKAFLFSFCSLFF